MKKIFILLLLFSLIPLAYADNFYAISENKILSNDFKIILLENVKSDILIDNQSIYYFTQNKVYSNNKTFGIENYNLTINGIKNFSLSDNNIFIKKDFEILTINKSSGELLQRNIYSYFLDNLFSYYSVSGSKGDKGDNGINGSNGINGTNGINQSDNLKINKTNIGEASGGILLDDRLSSNVVLENISNTFTSKNTFSQIDTSTGAPQTNNVGNAIIQGSYSSRVMSLYYGTDGSFWICVNCYWNGTHWLRGDSSISSFLTIFNYLGGIERYQTNAGANPIGVSTSSFTSKNTYACWNGTEAISC